MLYYTMTDKTEYYGKLTGEDIRLIQEVFNIVNEQNPCHMNSIIRMKILKTLETEFYEADSKETPSLKNKFVETITIQH